MKTLRRPWAVLNYLSIILFFVETNDADDFLREAGALKKLRHPNIVQLYGVCTQETPFYLVTEFMANGDLRNYLKKGI